MAYLLALLFFAQTHISREDAIKAAQERYKVLIKEAERKTLEAEIRNAKAGRTSNLVVRSAERDFELWKQGLHTPPNASLDRLSGPAKMQVGDIGTLNPFIVRSVNDDGTILISLLMLDQFGSPYHPEPAILRHNAKLPLSGQHRFDYKAVFWVSGKQGAGKTAVPVVEPLPIP